MLSEAPSAMRPRERGVVGGPGAQLVRGSAKGYAAWIGDILG
jgi:hypothetical protein